MYDGMKQTGGKSPAGSVLCTCRAIDRLYAFKNINKKFK